MRMLAGKLTLSPVLISMPSLLVAVGNTVAATGAGLVKFASLLTSQVLKTFQAVLPVLR